ncbi:MAG: 5-formyltetrahydrofolate cyclo-ligase [Oscillospiraceae bacterium]|nr:5-formyltetrahydrofolate cyclo-ligase [Oscillospiraceae bacterium]
MEEKIMNAIPDIREYKRKLREKYKDIRRNMSKSGKQRRDLAILERLISTDAYKNADIVLTYVSTDIEVDTRALINKAMDDKKRVAVPRCIDGTRDMNFYFIKSMDDLEKGTFSVLEPIPSKCVKAYAYEKALCIVPGLSFDMKGYRLGYGKGYYDRFLSAHPRLTKVGLCYCPCTVSELHHGRFDVSADMLITEKYIHRTEQTENTKD